MTVLQLVLELVKFLIGLMKMLERERFVREGELKAAARTTELVRARVEKAIQAREIAMADPLDADADGVPDDDGYRRD